MAYKTVTVILGMIGSYSYAAQSGFELVPSGFQEVCMAVESGKATQDIQELLQEYHVTPKQKRELLVVALKHSQALELVTFLVDHCHADVTQKRESFSSGVQRCTTFAYDVVYFAIQAHNNQLSAASSEGVTSVGISEIVGRCCDVIDFAYQRGADPNDISTSQGVFSPVGHRRLSASTKKDTRKFRPLFVHHKRPLDSLLLRKYCELVPLKPLIVLLKKIGGQCSEDCTIFPEEVTSESIKKLILLEQVKKEVEESN